MFIDTLVYILGEYLSSILVALGLAALFVCSWLFLKYYTDYKKEKETTTTKEPEVFPAWKSEAELESEKDFFDSQLEREKMIADKISVFHSDRVRRPVCKKNVPFTPEESQKEEEQRKKQLDYMLNLLKEQEDQIKQSATAKATAAVAAAEAATKNASMAQMTECPYKQSLANMNSLNNMNIFDSRDESDYKFSVLNEDGVYEERNISTDLRDKFSTQMRLYGL